ncbi:hypothetical protein IOC57_11920 [Bacillus sp. SD075]|uniref:hypothetical protein n=1 Tax=Bacillus sp. SD075 TaxID=2781732 RepID=UPI001A97782F|nr:hypothetical protein [Bacillus sp. SD075]MBO0998449.1 hypothetical protein [Bacillus sp. SD075]
MLTPLVAITVGSEERFMVEGAKFLDALLNGQSLKEFAVELYRAMVGNFYSDHYE